MVVKSIAFRFVFKGRRFGFRMVSERRDRSVFLAKTKLDRLRNGSAGSLRGQIDSPYLQNYRLAQRSRFRLMAKRSKASGSKLVSIQSVIIS